VWITRFHTSVLLGGKRLHNAAQIVTSWSIIILDCWQWNIPLQDPELLHSFNGSLNVDPDFCHWASLLAFLDSYLPDKISNFLNSLFMFWNNWPALLSVSVEVLPLVKGGMFSFTPFLVRRSLTVNPLSAITWSPCFGRSSKPLSWVTHWSFVLTVHNSYFETKEEALVGVIPTKSFTVLWCL